MGVATPLFKTSVLNLSLGVQIGQNVQIKTKNAKTKETYPKSNLYFSGLQILCLSHNFLFCKWLTSTIKASNKLVTSIACR